MQFHDSLTLDAPKVTRDGYLAVRAKAARSGVYDYLGSEVDPAGKHFKATDTVKVYRPESEVFDTASVGSFLMKPITDNHPAVSVTVDNWKEHARGVVGKALRDGEFLAFDLVLMDKALIDAVQSGKRELSNGYSCNLSFGDGVAPDGTAYQATQSNIIGNHIAVVDKGRAGSECRIADNKLGGGNSFALCDANPNAIISTGDYKMKLTLDGLPVTLTDPSEVQAAFDAKAKQIADKDAEIATAKGEVATLATDKATLEAKVVTLESQLADAAITPEKLRDAAKAYAAVADAAKAMGFDPDKDDSEDEIKKKAVAKKMGDVSANWTADQIAVSFATLAKDAKPANAAIVSISAPVANLDAAATRDQAYEDYKKSLTGKAA